MHQHWQWQWHCYCRHCGVHGCGHLMCLPPVGRHCSAQFNASCQEAFETGLADVSTNNQDYTPPPVQVIPRLRAYFGALFESVECCNGRLQRAYNKES
jgi:hypothetical protein